MSLASEMKHIFPLLLLTASLACHRPAAAPAVGDEADEKKPLADARDEGKWDVKKTPAVHGRAGPTSPAEPRVTVAPATPVGEVHHHAWGGVHVYSTAFSPDGRTYAAGGDGAALRLWNVASGQLIQELPHESWVNAVAFTADGKQVLTASQDKTVWLWDLASGKERRRFYGHTAGVLSVDVSPDGKTVLSASADGTLRWWDAANGNEIRQATSPEGSVTAKFLPGGKQALSWSGKLLRLWDVQTAKSVRQFEGHGENVWGAQFLPGDKQFISYAGDRTLRIWDLATGQTIRQIDLGPGLSNIRGVIVCPDGKRFLSGCDDDRTVRLRDLATGTDLYRFTLAAKPRGLSISPNGNLAVSGSFRGHVHLWGLPDPPVPVKPVDGLVCMLVNAHSARCLTVKEGSPKPGAAVVQGPWLGDAGGGERWRLQKVGDSWKITNTGNFQVVAAPGGMTDPGLGLIQWDDLGPAHLEQLWRMIPEGDHYRLESCVSGLDVTGENDKGEGAGIVQAKRIADPRQHWIIARADGELPHQDPTDPVTFRGAPARFDLLVVAPQRFRKALAPFLAHKNGTGLPAWAVFLDEVASDFPGADDPERIKRAIEYAHRLHRVKYVMLAGDSSRTPVRFRCVTPVDPASTTLTWDLNFAPAELYYANLYTDHRPDFSHGGHFSNWDRNGNRCYNEQRFNWGISPWGYNPDNVDACVDVALGRVPAHTEAELREYLERVVRYETAARAKGPRRFAFLADKGYDGAVDFSEQITQSLAGMKPAPELERLALGYGPQDKLPGSWKPAGDSDLPRAAGSAWCISYLGHGAPSGWGYGGDMGRVRKLDNRDHWPIVLAQACETGKLRTTVPWGRYRDVNGQAHEFTWDEVKRTAHDKETNISSLLPLIVPPPHPYDFPEAHDPMVACTWLHGGNGGGAIAYFGSVTVQPPGYGLGMLPPILRQMAEGDRVLGDVWLKAQRRYWLDFHSNTGDFHRDPRYYLCMMNLYGDPSLRLDRVDTKPVKK